MFQETIKNKDSDDIYIEISGKSHNVDKAKSQINSIVKSVDYFNNDRSSKYSSRSSKKWDLSFNDDYKDQEDKERELWNRSEKQTKQDKENYADKNLKESEETKISNLEVDVEATNEVSHRV